MDLHGCKFGDLRAEVIVGRDNGCIWRLRCLGCGGAVFMTAGEVRRRFAIVKDRFACPGCMREEKRSTRNIRLESVYRELWALTGTLYGGTWDEFVRREILSELEAKVAPVRTAIEVLPVATGEERDREASHPKPTQQRAMYLYPLRVRRGRIFLCITCKREFRRGLGCTLCVEPVCVKCVRKSAHTCTTERDYEDTYESIGNATTSLQPRAEGERQGITRERVRGIVIKALRKIRANCGVELGLRDMKRSLLREHLMNMKVDPIEHYGKLLDRIYLATVEGDRATVRDLRAKLEGAWRAVYPEDRGKLEKLEDRLERDKEEKAKKEVAKKQAPVVAPAVPTVAYQPPWIEQYYARLRVEAATAPISTLVDFARNLDQAALWCLRYLRHSAMLGDTVLAKRHERVLAYIQANPYKVEGELLNNPSTIIR